MSWRTQDSVYIIMWRSEVSGGTYSALRKTEQGKDNFINTLYQNGVDPSQVIISEQKKKWSPNDKKKSKPRGSQVTGKVVDIHAAARRRRA